MTDTQSPQRQDRRAVLKAGAGVAAALALGGQGRLVRAASAPSATSPSTAATPAASPTASRQRWQNWSGVISDVEATYNEVALRDDVEKSSLPDSDTQLPSRGMQVHTEYTLYGHFFYLARLLKGFDKVRFFLDQESGIRAAFLSAFQQRVKDRTADGFYVRINKINLTVNERRREKAKADSAFEQARLRFPGLTDRDVEIELIKERIAQMKAIGRWSDRWLLHPFPSMSEPDKAACFLTDLGDYAPDHLARLYQLASLHAIDRFFMQIRRRISLLERPIATASNMGRVWYGYSPYNPEVVAKMLSIFRVFYNYALPGEDKQTPAMRLGLADKKCSTSTTCSASCPPLSARYRSRRVGLWLFTLHCARDLRAPIVIAIEK
jgi:hypothetical protein